MRFVANALRPNKFMESAVIDTLFLIAAKWPPEYGGPGLYYKRHIRHLEKIARHVRIVAWSRGGVIDLGDASPNASAIAMKSPRGRLAAHVAGLRLAARLLWETRSAGSRCAILFTGGSVNIGWRATAMVLSVLGIPTVVENVLFGADDGPTLGQARWQFLTRIAVSRVRAFCPVSNGLVESLRSVFPAASVVHLPYGVDLGANTITSEESRLTERLLLGCSPDGLVAVSFGTVHARKGQLDLVDAWLKWVEVGKRFEARLFIVGPQHDPAYLERIEQRIAEAEQLVGSTVVLTGFSADVRRYLRAADVYMTAAIAEGLPISIVESLAHGVPVICRWLDGVTDDFMHGRAVTAVMNWSAEAVSAALDTLADGEAWRRASHDARAVAEDRFDIDKRLRIVERLLTDKTFESCPSCA